VANNVDAYYMGRGEAPGQWIGTTADQLGLVGRVDAAPLRNLLAGLSAAREPLGARLSADRRPGYDLTFSAPKGVSLLWVFGTDHTRDGISVVHDRAVGAVLDHLSAEACFVRRGAGGQQLLEANGFIGTAFRHRTSRAGDPQLHTHVFVPNLVQGADGRWSAPDGRRLHTWQKTAGTLYQSALRADIEAAMDDRGVTSASAAEKAALATRARKPDETAPLELLREGWRAQLAEIPCPEWRGGHHPATRGDLVLDTIDRRSAVLPELDHVEAVFLVLAGEARVSLDDWEIDEQLAPDTRAMPVTLFGSTFSRRDAICAVARAFDVTPDQALVLTLEFFKRHSIHRVLADSEAASLGDVDQDRTEQLRTEQARTERVRTMNGRLIPATSGDRGYTTTELLSAEERIIRSAVERIGGADSTSCPCLG
jgi:hypothetical protein